MHNECKPIVLYNNCSSSGYESHLPLKSFHKRLIKCDHPFGVEDCLNLLQVLELQKSIPSKVVPTPECHLENPL